MALADKPVITVGSKSFTEGFILSEIISQVIENAGEAKVNRRFGLGGTGIVFQAMQTGDIDIYPEYTGTISEVILKNKSIVSSQGLKDGLLLNGIVMSEPLGFNNTYALAISKKFGESSGIKSISDLARTSSLRAGFSYEFVKRPDGLSALETHYGFHLINMSSMEHSLAMGAIEKDQLDLTDIYSTDAKIKQMNLFVLKDDKRFFPDYYAVILARKEIVSRFPKTWRALQDLAGQIDEGEMISLNMMADIDKKSFASVASRFLGRKSYVDSIADPELLERVKMRTREHISLVLITLVVSILLGVPLGIVATRNKYLGQFILILSSVVQTIPSLALLCFLIPFFGIGTKPALVALVFYGLLPIIINTYTGLINIDQRQIESARALGLSTLQRLRLIEVPLASRSILSGIKTSAIISIGTATLAALIGAGGYGAPIVTGLALNDIRIILEGALPAAALALVTHGLFQFADRIIIPKGLR